MIKIYGISIPRFEKRRAHIVSELRKKTRFEWELVGIDALELRRRASIWRHNSQLRDSEVGCAISHREACLRMVAEGADYALIVEDDVILPNNIDEILLELSTHVSHNDVVSLYNRTIYPEKFSVLNAQSIFDMKLIYPMETRFMRTAAAYFLGHDAAKQIVNFNDPVRVVADNWAAYYQAGLIRTIRLLHPIPVSLQPFESTLATDRGSAIQMTVRRWANSIRVLQRIRAIRRRFVERKRERHLKLVHLPSDQIRNVE